MDKSKELPKNLSLSASNAGIDSKSGISEALLARLKQKEMKIVEDQRVKKEKARDEFDTIRTRGNELKKIAEIIKVYFTHKEVTSIYMVNVVEHVEGANKSLIMSKPEILSAIEFIIKHCPYWLSVIEKPYGKILKIDKTVPLLRIYEDIEKNCGIIRSL
eukprot:TRINITY_DN3508_c0_g1_i1.p3 TRINITY_DN3508_c0_g1~~TRINITY_DN3508_c0_g1_i1.p3  ORF type:complete len:160 (+),score=42.03 TRINITY_DN3508_c0_g1_i1:457-936(+)